MRFSPASDPAYCVGNGCTVAGTERCYRGKPLSAPLSSARQPHRGWSKHRTMRFHLTTASAAFSADESSQRRPRNGSPDLPAALRTQHSIKESLPFVPNRSLVSDKVQFSSDLFVLRGDQDYTTAMEQWTRNMPERLPGFEVELRRLLAAEPGVIVVRWKAQWRTQRLLSFVREQHFAFHRLGDRDSDKSVTEPTPQPKADDQKTYCVFGSSRLLLDEQGHIYQHHETFDFEPEGAPEERAWALFDYFMALRTDDESRALWLLRVVRLFLVETLKRGAVADEVGVMNDEERETFLTQVLLLNIGLAAGLAAVVAAVLIRIEKVIGIISGGPTF